MNIFFRILLAIYAFCLALISGLVMYLTIWTEVFTDVNGILEKEVFAEGAVNVRIAVFAVALVFFLLSLIFLFSGFKGSKDRKGVVRRTEIGEVKISINTIENTALNAVKKISGVRESKTGIKKAEDGIIITMKIVVMPDLSIPGLSEEIQNAVKKSVEETTGIIVKAVSVFIDSIYSGTTVKARVE